MAWIEKRLYLHIWVWNGISLYPDMVREVQYGRLMFWH